MENIIPGTLFPHSIYALPAGMYQILLNGWSWLIILAGLKLQVVK